MTPCSLAHRQKSLTAGPAEIVDRDRGNARSRVPGDGEPMRLPGQKLEQLRESGMGFEHAIAIDSIQEQHASSGQGDGACARFAKGLRIVRPSTWSPSCMSSLQSRVQPPSSAAATISAS
jgi:hypothetical protein